MNEDLSIYHHPLTGIFPRGDVLRNISLSPEQLEFFNANGYLAGIRILEDDRIEAFARTSPN